METTKSLFSKNVSIQEKKNKQKVFQVKTPMDELKDKTRQRAIAAAGKYVEFSSGISGLLVGALYFNYEPFFVLVNKGRNITLVSAIEKFDYADYDINFSVLNYIRTHNPEVIVELVSKKVAEKYGDVMMTPITVNPVRDRQKNNNKRKH